MKFHCYDSFFKKQQNRFHNVEIDIGPRQKADERTIITEYLLKRAVNMVASYISNSAPFLNSLYNINMN